MSRRRRRWCQSRRANLPDPAALIAPCGPPLTHRVAPRRQRPPAHSSTVQYQPGRQRAPADEADFDPQVRRGVMSVLGPCSRVGAPVSRPVLALADTAQIVTRERDYSIRARRFSEDWLGQLWRRRAVHRRSPARRNQAARDFRDPFRVVGRKHVAAVEEALHTPRSPR
jgi:hypothetical protein